MSQRGAFPTFRKVLSTKLSEKLSMEILAKFTGCEKRLAEERERKTGSTVPRLQNCLMCIEKQINEKKTINTNKKLKEKTNQRRINRVNHAKIAKLSDVHRGKNK